MLDALEETGRRDNTCVILLADHGELPGDHGFAGKEERHYDACIRVPLISAGPGLKQGNSRDETVLKLTADETMKWPHVLLPTQLMAAMEWLSAARFLTGRVQVPNGLFPKNGRTGIRNARGV